MGKSYSGGEGGRLPWERGASKRDQMLKAIGNFGSAGGKSTEVAKAPEDETGSKSPEPISTLPDYSGNEKTFDPSDFQNYVDNAFPNIIRYVRSLEEDVKKYLNGDDQDLFAELVEQYPELYNQHPKSKEEAEELEKKIDNVWNKLSGMQDRVNTRKEFDQAEKEQVSTGLEAAEGKTLPEVPKATPDEFGYSDYLVKAQTYFDQDKKKIEAIHAQLDESEQIFYKHLVAEADSLAAATPVSEVEARQLQSRVDHTLKMFDKIIKREKLSVADLSYKETPLVPREAVKNVVEEKPESGYASAKMVEYPYKTGTEKIEPPQVTFSMSGNEVSFANETNIEKKLEDIKKIAEIRSEIEVPNYAYKTEAVEDPLAGIDTKLFEAALNEELHKEQAAFNNSVSVIKLKEKDPSMTDEQINAELERRHRNYREFLQLRKELKEGFLPYYEAKNKYRETYKNQLSGGYTIYKRTNWLSKMFGFNPKNLNALAAAERNEFAGTRVAYREKLEGLLNNKLINTEEYSDLVVAGNTAVALKAKNMIQAAMADRFLLRPARETLKLQNEIFPETDRKNIINKFKAVIKAHPRLAMGVGATAAISTVATGGLAAIIPMTFGAGGAAIAGILSTKFGVNKSERALDSALKNATLGLTADDIVAAEMKLITAHQDVEISKNRRDVYTTLGGVAGGLVGGSVYGYMNSGSEIMVPGPAEVTPPATDGPIVAPEPHIEAPPQVVTPEPAVPPAPETPAAPDLPATPETPTPPAPEPAPEGEPELGDEEEGEEEEIYPPGQEPQNIYEVQSGDNFWNIMEGQTAAPQPPTMDWIEQNQPEHYQELIKLVENYANADSELRSMLGFEGTMDDLQIGSEVNLDLLDYLARSIAEDRGWIDHVEIDMPQVSPEMEEIINTKVKTIMV